MPREQELHDDDDDLEQDEEPRQADRAREDEQYPIEIHPDDVESDR